MKNLSEILVLDGPMGTEIQRRGGDTSLPLWSARELINNPMNIVNIHRDYIKSGADIITTNTFRTQDYTLTKAGYDGKLAQKLTKKAVNLALIAAKEEKSKIKVAGSVAPIEDCYSPNLTPKSDILRIEHNSVTEWLHNAGIDIFLVETMNTIREARIAVDSALRFDKPIYLSFTADESGRILGGAEWSKVKDQFANDVDVIMVNCTTLEGTRQAICEFEALGIDSWGCYPNFGQIDETIGWKLQPITKEYIDSLREWIKLTPNVIGTCCGATPMETTKLRDIISRFKQ